MACVVFWIFRPSPSFDINRIEPRLRTLQQPYQSIKTAYYLDGGSIGIEIVDRDGKTEQFAIPANELEKKRYARVFVGAMYANGPSAVAVSDSEQTKRMLIWVLASMPHRTTYDDLCLMHLRHRPSDDVHCFVRKLREEF